MSAASPRVYVMLTMRLDFLGDCARFQGLPEALSEGQFLVPNLSRAERRAAIEEPAQKCGATDQPGRDAAPAERDRRRSGPASGAAARADAHLAGGEGETRRATVALRGDRRRRQRDLAPRRRRVRQTGERRAARDRGADVQGDLRAGPARPRDPPALAVRRHPGDHRRTRGQRDPRRRGVPRAGLLLPDAARRPAAEREDPGRHLAREPAARLEEDDGRASGRRLARRGGPRRQGLSQPGRRRGGVREGRERRVAACAHAPARNLVEAEAAERRLGRALRQQVRSGERAAAAERQAPAHRALVREPR